MNTEVLLLSAMYKVLQCRTVAVSDDLSQTRIVVVSCFGVALGVTLLALLGFAPDPFQSPPGICLSWMTAPATPGTHEQMVYTGLTITIAFLSTIICTVVAVKCKHSFNFNV